MAITSMTGFGAGEAAADGHTVRVTVSSVNRRQLDVRCILPRELSEIEHDLRRLVQQAVSRGMVTITVEYAAPAHVAANAVVDRALLRELCRELREVG